MPRQDWIEIEKKLVEPEDYDKEFIKKLNHF